MADLKKIRGWSHHRQLLGHCGAGLPRILAAVVGVYSSHPSGPLSLRARARTFSAAAFHRLDEKRQALRVPAMRQSVYLLPAATARLAAGATILPPEDPSWKKRWAARGRSLPAAQYPRWREQVLKCARRPLSAAAIKEEVGIPDLSVKTVLNRMAFEGVLLRVGDGGLRSNTLTYVATRSWVVEHRPPFGEEEPLAWLAGEYLRAFGPARVKDFQWWAGVTARQAKAAFAAHKTVPLDEAYLLRARDRAEFEAFRASRGDTVDVLPPWDSYTMGYAPDGRARFVDPAMQDRIYRSVGATGGNASGVILVNGLAHAEWSSRFQGKKMLVTLRVFERMSAKAQKRMRRELEDVALLLEAGELVVDVRSG